MSVLRRSCVVVQLAFKSDIYTLHLYWCLKSAFILIWTCRHGMIVVPVVMLDLVVFI